MFTQPQQRQGAQSVNAQQGQENIQRPTWPTASETNLFNSDPSDIDFGLDPDTGQLTFIQKTKPQDQKQDQQQQVQDQTQQVSGNGTDVSNQSDQEWRNSIEGAIKNLAMYVEGLGKGMPIQQHTQQQQKEEVKLDTQSDDFGTQLISIINTSIKNALDERLNPINSKMAIVDDRMELSDLAVRYGKDFVDLYPAMQVIKEKSDPSVKWETIYQAVKKIPSLSTTKDSTTQVGNGTNPSQPSQQGTQGNAQQTQNQQQSLQQKANQLSTERGGAPRGIVSDEPKIDSVEAAFNKAMSDLFSGR